MPSFSLDEGELAALELGGQAAHCAERDQHGRAAEAAAQCGRGRAGKRSRNVWRARPSVVSRLRASRAVRSLLIRGEDTFAVGDAQQEPESVEVIGQRLGYCALDLEAEEVDAEAACRGRDWARHSRSDLIQRARKSSSCSSSMATVMSRVTCTAGPPAGLGG
jgi:hypothetical protein